jgi:hypothetical protein
MIYVSACVWWYHGTPRVIDVTAGAWASWEEKACHAEEERMATSVVWERIQWWECARDMEGWYDDGSYMTATKSDKGRCDIGGGKDRGNKAKGGN